MNCSRPEMEPQAGQLRGCRLVWGVWGFGGLGGSGIEPHCKLSVRKDGMSGVREATLMSWVWDTHGQWSHNC